LRALRFATSAAADFRRRSPLRGGLKKPGGAGTAIPRRTNATPAAPPPAAARPARHGQPGGFNTGIGTKTASGRPGYPARQYT